MTRSRSTARVRPGDAFPTAVLRSLRTLDGAPVALPAPGRLLHLEMRRFAGCPICDLHLRRIGGRLPEIRAAGVDEVAVFHSSLDELRRYEAGLPMTAAADPGTRLYAAIGMGRSPRAFVHPGLLRHLPAMVAQIVRSARAGRLPRVGPPGGELGLPADVLVGPDGRVVDAHYGAHAADQWSVDEILARAPRVAGGR